MARGERPKRRKNVAMSLTALAEAVERAPSTVGAWRERDDWPVKRNPPWTEADLAKILAFRDGLRKSEEQKRRRTEEHVAEKVERAKLTRAKRRLAELELSRERRKLVPLADVEARTVRQIAAVRAGLLSLVDSLPDELASEPRERWREIIAFRVDRLLDDFAGGMS